MTNNTIFSLVSSYTTKLQNHKSTANSKVKGDFQSELGVTEAIDLESIASEKLPQSSFCDTLTLLIDLENESLQYIKCDVQSIVCEVLGVDKTYLYMHSDKVLDASTINKIDEKINRYNSSEPLAYILGYKYFWNQKLKVTQDTLIPRSDTEVLVQAVLDDIITSRDYPLNNLDTLSVLDLGTGTGAIALALAGELPNAMVVAVDYSTAALNVAKENAINNNINNVEFVQSDWYKNIKGKKFDIIVSNPPYIDSYDNDIDEEVKDYEPALALFANDNGLADIEAIISQAKYFLAENGRIYIEHGYTQSASVLEIFQKHGFVNAEIIQDLNSRDRCSKAERVR